MARYINSIILKAYQTRLQYDQDLKKMNERALKQYCAEIGVTNWTQRVIWDGLYEHQWKPTVEKIKGALSVMRTQSWCLDATYRCFGSSVKSRDDWQTLSDCALTHDIVTVVLDEALVKRTAERLMAEQARLEKDDECTSNDDDDQKSERADVDDKQNEDAILDFHTKRARMCDISCSQFVISDENEMVHLVVPINGMQCTVQIAYTVSELRCE
jgi:hypothetical protein